MQSTATPPALPSSHPRDVDRSSDFSDGDGLVVHQCNLLEYLVHAIPPAARFWVPISCQPSHVKSTAPPTAAVIAVPNTRTASLPLRRSLPE